jgi:hypothetical protein
VTVRLKADTTYADDCHKRIVWLVLLVWGRDRWVG